MLCDGIVEAIGGTPLVRLKRLYADLPLEVYGKIEALNPGGSSKDRPALEILRAAMEEGTLRPGALVVESSSGNMGVGLAQFCRYHGLRFICVVDARTAPQNLAILAAYGAEVQIIHEPDESGDLLLTRIARVQYLLAENPGSFWPMQYANRNNPAAHYGTTIQEIVQDLGSPPDVLFCAVSTCGTIRGCAEYLKEQGASTRIMAVDAKGSVIFGCPPNRRMVPGLGAGRVPELHKPDLVDEVVHVSDIDCIVGCRRLVHHEAILAGGSSGGVVEAVRKVAPRLPAGSRCVAILPDRGERYLDLVFNDDWVRQYFGEPEELENLEMSPEAA